MRTQGTFQVVYEQARLYSQFKEEHRSCPMDPEVRFDGDEWMIESSLSSAEYAKAVCKLEVFDNYFFESYKEDDLELTINDENDFLKMITQE